MFLFQFLFFAIGAIIASFIGVIVARLNTGQGFVLGRSHCDSCNKRLSTSSLIPIVSYFIFGGRSNCCGSRLSIYSPLSELLLGFLFVLAYLKIGFNGALFCMLISISLLFALVLCDINHQILPPVILSMFIAISSITSSLTATSFNEFLNTLITAILIALSLALIHLLSRGRAMGFADSPFVFGLSLLVGVSAFSGFIFSFWLGAIIGIAILAKRSKGNRMGVEVPFAPFLAAGFLIAYFTQWNPFAIIAIFL